MAWALSTGPFYSWIDDRVPLMAPRFRTKDLRQSIIYIYIQSSRGPHYKSYSFHTEKFPKKREYACFFSWRFSWRLTVPIYILTEVSRSLFRRFKTNIKARDNRRGAFIVSLSQQGLAHEEEMLSVRAWHRHDRHRVTLLKSTGVFRRLQFQTEWLLDIFITIGTVF